MLDKLIDSLLGTRSEKLSSQIGVARQLGIPYDPQRLELFLILREALVARAPISRFSPLMSPQALANLANPFCRF